MVTIGSLTWVSKVENAGRAQQKANRVGDAMNNAAEQANEANSAFGGVSKSLGGVSSIAKRTAGRFGRLTAMTSLLRSSMIFLIGTMSMLTGAGGLLGGLGGGLGGFLSGLGAGSLASKAKGLGKRIAGWIGRGLNSVLGGTIVGSIASALGISAAQLVGATALGATIGGLIVGGLQATGVMDAIKGLGGDVRGAIGGGLADAFLAFTSPAIAPLATFGGFINGFVGNVMEDGIVGGIKAGLNEANEVFMTFVGSWERTLQRALSPVTDPARDLGERFAQSNPGAAETIHTGFTQNPIFDFGAATGQALRGERTAQNVVLGAPGEFERDTAAFLDPRQGWQFTGFQSGGMVQETGPALVHEGEAVLPADLVRAIRGGSGGPTIETVNVEIGDQQLNLSNLSRIELEELADAIAREMGTEVENIV